MRLYQLADTDVAFPPVNGALTEPNGLLAVGGDLQAKRLINAYSKGIFPWFSEGDPLMWWSPDPRAIINIRDLRINRTLRKALKKSSYTVTVNTDFEHVIGQCANAPFRDDGIWILPEMQLAYIKLHQLGYAHSIEVWKTDGEVWKTDGDDTSMSSQVLVGGLYGVAINGFFSGESMYYSEDNASKFALVALATLLNSQDIDFIDCQLLNPFLADMGAVEITRESFVKRQQTAIKKQIPASFWQARQLQLR